MLVGAFVFALPVAIGIVVARLIESKSQLAAIWGSVGVKRAQFAVFWSSVGVWILLIVVYAFGFVMDTATYHYNKGLKYYAQNQAHPNSLSEQQFKLAIDRDPDFAEAHMNLGKYYLDTGWLEGAEKETKIAIDIFERSHNTQVQGATWEEALSIGYNNLGVIAIKRIAKNPGEAVSLSREAKADFSKALELDPNNARAHVNLEKYQGRD